MNDGGGVVEDDGGEVVVGWEWKEGGGGVLKG